MAQKRDNGTGTIYRRDNKSWVGKIYLGRDESGKEKFKYLSGKTEGEVKRKIREFNQSGTRIDAKKISLGEYLLGWLTTYKKDTVKPSSYDRLESSIRNQIIPNIGMIQLQQLTSDDIQSFLSKLKNEDNYSHSVITAKSIPRCVKEHGVPFWSKYASDMIYRLQSHNFQWEDEPYEVLMERYPNCKTALGWWCNISKGTSMYTIDRAPFLKEFMIQNPPTFKISNKCCEYAKKKTSAEFQKNKGYDLCCIGVRKNEGGIRATHKTCFSESDSTDQFRPIFWLRDIDKEEYCAHYGVTHSRCYTEYGLQRTGCFGCPFGKRFEEELLEIEKHEPKLLKAANSIFGQSYEYTRKYLAFREEMKQKQSVSS